MRKIKIAMRFVLFNAFATALAIPLVWNLMLWIVHRRVAFALNLAGETTDLADRSG